MTDSGTRNRLRRTVGLGLILAGLAGGCGPGEPQVTSEFAPAPNAPKASDPNPKLPPSKQMPKNTSAGLKIDPQTGRPSGP